MAYLFGTPEWAAAYWKTLQENTDFKEIAEALHASIAFVILPNMDAGLDEEICFLVDLKNGDASSIRLAVKEETSKADYAFIGDYFQWKAVVQSKLDPVKEVMRGKLKVRGNALKIHGLALYVRAVRRLVGLAANIETRFPDELAPISLDHQ